LTANFEISVFLAERIGEVTASQLIAYSDRVHTLIFFRDSRYVGTNYMQCTIVICYSRRNCVKNSVSKTVPMTVYLEIAQSQARYS